MKGMTHLEFSSNNDPGTASAYQTTYKSYFHWSSREPATYGRTKSSKLFPSPPSQGRLNSSIYRHDYITNPVNMDPQVRYGTSSGLRKNNPHPHNMIHAFKRPDQTMVVWNHYTKLPPLHQDEPGNNSEALLKEFCMAKTQSTYQSDFLRPVKGYFGGTPPTFANRPDMNLSTDGCS